MSKKSKRHHFISEFYLRGFTRSGSKDSRLVVLDAKKRSRFETTAKNVANERNFNMLNIQGVSSDELENNLAKFEGEVAKAIRNIEKTNIFEGKSRDYILNLIALFAIRSPFNREHYDDILKEISRRALGILSSRQEIWDAHVEKGKAQGFIPKESTVSRQKVKSFIESDQYKIKFSRETHIKREFDMLNIIIPLLFKRNWLLLESHDESCPFITCNRPVILQWQNPHNVPAFARHSPGFLCPQTDLIFPLTKRLALVGNFERKRNETVKCSEKLVAMINSSIISNAAYQIYVPFLDFCFYNFQLDGVLLGTELLKKFC